MKTARVLLILAALAPAASAGSLVPQVPLGPPRSVDDLNLGFETAGPAGQPAGWYAGGNGYSATLDASDPKDGARSLRLALAAPAPSPNAFGVATGSFPVADVLGSRLRLRGWIRTERITSGWAGLWMRVDGPGGALAFDNMQARGIRGTTPWSPYEIVLEVPKEATNINFGALLTGDGVAWIDALRFEILPPAAPVTVTGTVHDAEGRPAPGAFVTLAGNGRLLHARCDAGGVFSIVAPPGEYALTATAPGSCAAWVPLQPVEVDKLIDVRLGNAGRTITGRVIDDAGAPVPGVPVGFAPANVVERIAYFTESDASGRYSLTLPIAEGYVGRVDSPGHVALETPLPAGQQVLELPVVRKGEAPADVVEWVRAHAVPLKSVEAGQGFEDMEPLRAIVGDARVVALGEATHGSREFFQLKHRWLEFLVEKMGFSLFAIEANWPESLALDRYVLTGKGDPRAGLAGIYFWTWNTEEVLSLVEWMRRYNADTAHARKVHFQGFDMQTPDVAARRAAEYLRKVEPERGAALAEPLAAAQGPLPGGSLTRLARDDQERLKTAVNDLLARFDARRGDWVARSSESEWMFARQHLVIVRQAAEMRLGSGSTRDESMAANVRWLLDQSPSGTRAVLWAHNGHVSRATTGSFRPMGSFLAEALGKDYVSVGFAFARGSFQAIDWSQGQGRPGRLAEHTVGAPPPDSIDAAFEKAGLPQFALDLRARGVNPLPAWFSVPRPMRETGAVFTNVDAMVRPVVLPQAYDAVLFVRQTTRARPVIAPTSIGID